MKRLNGRGDIDRSVTLTFRFDGRDFTGHPGDTLASALLANNVYRVGTSLIHGRPRGIMTAGVDEPNAIVAISAPYAEPMVTATTVELVDGLEAHPLTGGRGRLVPDPDPARADAMHAHCEVLVVGAGPAGLYAALTAARAGLRVVLLDDQPRVGGSIPTWDVVREAHSELGTFPDVRILTRTSAFGRYDDGFVLAVEQLPGGARRVWRIRAEQIVLATGAHERPIAFDDNDRPGIMLADAAKTYLYRYGVLTGRDVSMFVTHDGAYEAAFALARAGAEVTVADTRTWKWRALDAECENLGVVIYKGHAVTATWGEKRIRAAQFTPLAGGEGQVWNCDLLLVSGGWTPAVHLYSHGGGRLRYAPKIGAFVPAGSQRGVRVAGAAAGAFALGPCARSGVEAGAAAVRAVGRIPVAPKLPRGLGRAAEVAPEVVWSVPGDPTRQFVDLQRDSTVADVRAAVGAGLESVELVKRFTTIGTAHDQGKTSGLLAAGITAAALGVDIATLGTTSYRPPYTPVPFAVLAGRDRGALFDPERVTALHAWHVAQGAEFENVGQWKRPYYYPRAGEDLDAAVLRECAAVRDSVGLLDGSTLGKINVQGADAGEFLDRMYTNIMSSLAVGAVRYGVLCGLDGMVLDDGTVMRVSETEFVLTTTTGNAAKVLDWMEEFAQTEWPALDVRLTSVTEHWATLALVGPQSRAVLAAVAPSLDVSREAFGFMTWRSAVVAGVDARVCRISFSGELAYEINVLWWDALAVWTALLAAGLPYAITPYGTETMHVLRAEKGYPIIGQDTDGTVTPQDLGLGWAVSKKKLDFVGKRSFARAENLRPDRKQLVGLLPVDPEVRLTEGAALIASSDASVLPVPMLGHVTSSYRSAALGRTFALGLLRSGRERHGETVYAWHDGVVVPATVTDFVLFDPANERRDG